jgi:tetratricopeptide (TPR) repeat protein
MLTNARRWLAGWLVPVVVAATAYVSCREPHCEEVHTWGNWGGAVVACRAGYEATGSLENAALLADAHMRRREWDALEPIALALQTTRVRGTAFRLRAMVADWRNERALAAIYASTALAIHVQEGDTAGLLRDAHALGGIWWAHGAYDASLASVELTRDLALRLGDRRAAGYGEVGRADAFRMLGDNAAANGALAAAFELLDRPCDRAWAHLRKGLVYVAEPILSLADDSFTRAMADAGSCERGAVIDSAHLNMAWTAVMDHRADDAERHLRAVPDPGEEADYLRGLIAFERGDLAAADELLAKAERALLPDGEWPWEIADLRAQVAEAQGDDVRAEAAYLRALAAIATLRERTPDSTAHVVAVHRSPYEGLLALRARHGRWRDALAVVVELDAGGALPVTSAPARLWRGDVVVAGRAPRPPRAALPSGALASTDDVIEAWRGRDLSIVVATRSGLGRTGRDRVWRLRVVDGDVTGVDVGDAKLAVALADRLEHDHADGEAAESLGAMFAPDGEGELHVLPVGQLARIPLAALRRRGELVVASRPILRVLGVLPKPRRNLTWTSAAVVLGDPRHNLPSALAEAIWVAGEQRATLYAGAQATLDKLASGANADLLHVAAHTDERQREPVLFLADAELTPDLLRERGIAPRLAVLSSCGSAAARDEGGWGSLAAALLAGGTEVVIATERTIGDDATLDLVRRFYAAGGRRSPVAALAAAQVELARSATTSDWAYFTALAGPPERVVKR